MNGHSKLLVVAILASATVFTWRTADASQVDPLVDTYVVRSSAVVPQTGALSPATLLG